MKRTPWLCALVLILLAGPDQHAAQIPVGKAGGPGPQKVLLEGYVFDSARKPLGGVDVTVWVAGKADSVKGGRTDPKTGKYSFEVNVSGSFDVSFIMSRYFTSVVTHLAEQKDQQISKVLYVRGEKVPATAAHEYLQSVDRILFLACTLPVEKRVQFVGKFDSEPSNGGPFGLKFYTADAFKGDNPTVVRLLLERQRELQTRIETIGNPKE